MNRYKGVGFFVTVTLIYILFIGGFLATFYFLPTYELKKRDVNPTAFFLQPESLIHLIRVHLASQYYF